MDFSDEEEEMLPESVSNYYFVDAKEAPISFCVLPFRWQDGRDVETSKKQVFLHGVGDDGLQKIYKQVTEWKLELDGIRPVMYVLSKDQKWLQLAKPRKSYADIIRKILITVQCIHYLRTTPEASEESLWSHLRKEFSHFEVRPSPADLQDHLPFIHDMSQRDEAFANCQLLPRLRDAAFSKRSGGNGDISESKNSDFINDEDEDADGNEGANGNNDASDSDEDEDCFDSVCAICDNGGALICCEGRCLRSFHAFKGAGGADVGNCKTLCYTRAQVEAIQNFLCPNCRYKQHQCFACGKLGSSDRSAGAEVFPCVSATCGHFYHPKCVAKLFHPKDESDAMEQEKKIAAGEPFICPVHKCHVCRQGENKEVEELQFAVCRRCPTSYHRKCLPSEICFADSDDDSDEDSGILYRAWNNLLPNRILIFCMKHKIDPELETPSRNHLKFPEDPEAPEKKRVRVLSSTKDKFLGKKAGQDLLEEQPPMKKAKLVRKPSLVQENGIAMARLKAVTAKVDKTSIEQKTAIKEKAKVMKSREIEPSKTSKSLLRDLLIAKVENASATTTVKKLIPLPEVDSETEKRAIALAQRSPSSLLTLDKFIKQKDIPSTHAYAARHVDKTVTLGKVETSIEAIQMALQKVKEDGGNTDNAKAICEPAIVMQIAKWRNKLAVYLSPFLHGLLYTSFGRHFTKVEKLKEIVDRLHWYVQSGDMIVDFCCGANDFSTLMKEKLEATGKKCLYRNFDIIPPKNDFNFVKRDWMKVRIQELPPGNQLIMGLNPPFGIKGALANKFIDKALEFRPKLVVLIVPKETERLDQKRGTAYDLIWEDDQKLSGKAFYMPGNVDVNDKQLEQWNVSPPPLYLWSRPNWTRKHREIAKQHGHLGDTCGESAAAAMEKQIPTQMETKITPLREEKSEQVVGAEKVEVSSKRNEREADAKEAKLNEREVDASEAKPNERKADSKEAEPVQKKESRTSRRNRKRKQKQGESKKEETPAGNEASDMSISPRDTGTRKDMNDHMHEEEHTRETKSSIAAIQRYGETYERLNMKEDNNKRPTPPQEVDYPLSSIYNRDTHIGDTIYGMRRSEEPYHGYAGGSSYGLDRSVDGIRADGRRYGQPRSADTLSDIQTYAALSSGYGSSVSGLGLSGLPSATYGYGEPTIRSSVTDRYTSRMSPGLPSSSRGLSATDRYAPGLDDPNFARRNSGTPDTPLLRRGSLYGTPGAWNSGTPAYQPGNRYSSSGWIND